MDSDVSWRRAILMAKYRYPNADQCTIIHLAKQIYLLNNNFLSTLNNKEKVSKKSSVKLKNNYFIQGANA